MERTITDAKRSYTFIFNCYYFKNFIIIITIIIIVVVIIILLLSVPPQIMKSETSRISHEQQAMKEKIKVRTEHLPHHIIAIALVWCGVVWCGVVWYSVVWCGVI